MGVLKYECMCFIGGSGVSLWMGGALFAGGISGRGTLDGIIPG